jgi:hypothetical protein
VAANGRNGPVVSDSSGFERKLVRWCRIRPVVSDWSVGLRGPVQNHLICYQPLAAWVNFTGSDPRPEAACDLASFRGSSRCVSPISLMTQVLQSIT